MSESPHSYKVTGDHLEKAHSLGSCPLHKNLQIFYFSSVAPGEARLHHQCIKLIIQKQSLLWQIYQPQPLFLIYTPSRKNEKDLEM